MVKIINMRSRKAQEEMIGFVLIVVIVAVIGLIFFAIMINQSKPTGLAKSIEVEKRLESIERYTTDCKYSGRAGYRSIYELTRDCIEYNRLCENEKYSCSVLQDTLGIILNSTIMTGDDSPNKGYKLKVYVENNNQTRTIMEIPNGKFIGIKTGADYSINSDQGIVITVLELYHEAS